MAAALLLAVAVPGAASADAPPPSSVRTAYWWVPEPVTGLIPAPGVPADGLYVASSPGGTQAMSALSLTGQMVKDLIDDVSAAANQISANLKKNARTYAGVEEFLQSHFDSLTTETGGGGGGW